ncbi:class I SAM-dependent methyltransferase [Sulfitobacter sp. D35]|uniref:class I SAM-dependent methyltransferase n=1 Tax=Sulfitobacter sp. D35 TaxID=3083252 RepID=UPI00296FA20D|nr:class I SAM-dependent methyltransferase [Sulfitobacter sp. D35]MDW4496661.1 class I SAM-dependent methyltransferase [Sulfitobacter sp. D35]
MTVQGLNYIPALIEAFRAGQASDHVHLGYWPDGVSLDWRGAQRAMTVLHLDALVLDPGQTLVDIGCGLGGSLRVANRRVSGSSLVGVNIDPRQLELCQRIVPANSNRLSWIEGDAGAVALPDGCADRVLSLEAMFHFPCRRAFLHEAARLLRRGGRLVCSDIQFEAPRDDDARRWLDVATTGYAPWPEPVIAAEAVAEMAATAGFCSVTTRDLSQGILPGWDWITDAGHSPLRSPVAALRDLQRAGLLRYQFHVFEKP